MSITLYIFTSVLHQCTFYSHYIGHAKVNWRSQCQRSLTTEQLITGISKIISAITLLFYISLQGHSSLCRSEKGHKVKGHSPQSSSLLASPQLSWLSHICPAFLYTVTVHYVGHVKVTQGSKGQRSLTTDQLVAGIPTIIPSHICSTSIHFRSVKIRVTRSHNGQIKVTHHRAVRRRRPHNYLSRHTFVPLQCTRYCHIRIRPVCNSRRFPWRNLFRHLENQGFYIQFIIYSWLIRSLGHEKVTHLFHFNAHVIAAFIFARFTIPDGFSGAIFFVTWEIEIKIYLSVNYNELVI